MQYEDAKFAHPERNEFETDDLIDVAVEDYLNSRKPSPTSTSTQFKLSFEALRRRAGIGCDASSA